MSGLKMVLNPFTFPDLTIPNGFLVNDMGCQACWYFYTLAEKLRQRVGNSTEDQFGLLEGELWMDKRYEPIALAVTTMYHLSSPDDFGKFWPLVEQQAARMGFPPPHPEYRNLKRFVKYN